MGEHDADIERSRNVRLAAAMHIGLKYCLIDFAANYEIKRHDFNTHLYPFPKF
jgi:hypothetical protein